MTLRACVCVRVRACVLRQVKVLPDSADEALVSDQTLAYIKITSVKPVRKGTDRCARKVLHDHKKAAR